ncbi:MAG: U32 family peptidase [Lentisphaeraceae bacterium]|nr:U32 family peptidase [Lentisphaeraceae bacterium]
MVKRENIDILAPAGCYPSLRAAGANGADAVYFGVAQLNMRARARKSFHLKELPEIMGVCREYNMKGYLTLNTIVYQHDLILMNKLMDVAAKEKVDGVIVADMAAVQAALARGLEVHLSTQLSLSNYEAIKFYAPYCDRIVLARELNLTMIRGIYDNIVEDQLCGVSGEPMEIEAFAHGALCVAVSGRCGMSLFTSNASANRGACEQNCRKEYIVTDKETGKQLEVDNNFIMSPNDIATIDFMDKILESGISVLKLEGRGRSPEYVATVTRAYRQAVDAVYEGTYTPEFIESLNEELKKVYNRGMSSGYYLGREQSWSGSNGSKATRRKVLVGHVSAYFGRISVAEVTIDSHGFEKGDEYIIVGNTSGLIEGEITEMRLNEVTVESVKRGDVFSMKISEKARRNDKIYKLEIVNA